MTENFENKENAQNNDVMEALAKLAEFGVADTVAHDVVTKLGIESVEDLGMLEADDFVGAGMKLVQARKIVASMKPAPEPVKAVQAETAVATRAVQAQFESLLPVVPSDDSWLTALKTGGILKVDDSSYIAAIRAALADRAGLYNVPAALTEAMEKYADETEEQVDPSFYALRKQMTRRTYGDIFEAIDGLDGTFISDKRRREFLSRVNATLWQAIIESFYSIDGWYQTWRASFSDPSMLLAAISGGLAGVSAGAGMMAPPDTTELHEAGEALVDAINRVFRGTGVQIAAAMAYDANNIRRTLEDPRLPAMVGARNREQMLKKIGVNVSSNYVRLEQNLVKYVLGFVKYDTVTSDVEVNYFVALWQLGSQINWAELGGGNVGGRGIRGLTGNEL